MELSESSRPFKQCARCKAWSYGDAFQKDAYKAGGKRSYCPRCNNIMHVFIRACEKIKTFDLYGGDCACCGENRTEFLCLDHIAGGGSAERRARGHVGLPASNEHHYKRIAKSGTQDPNFRILCHNCNMAHGFFGYCPHKDTEPCVA